MPSSSSTTDRGIGSLVKSMAGLAQAVTPPSTSPPKQSPLQSPPPGTLTTAAPAVAPADPVPTPATSAADPSIDTAPAPTDSTAAGTTTVPTETPTDAASTGALTGASMGAATAPAPAVPDAAAPTPTITAAAPAAASISPALPPLTAADLNTPEGYAARIQADAAGRVSRMENQHALQQEHPHMFMMADYLKNFATTINPKANTAPGTGPYPPFQSAGAPYVSAVPHTSLPAGAAVAPAPLSHTASLAAQQPKGLADPSTQPPAYMTGTPQNAPARQGSSALASIVEDLQARIEALTAAHLNAARSVAGLPLLPVYFHGYPHGLPPLTSAAGVDKLSDEDLAAWAEYYLGDSQTAALSRAATVKAIQASIGVAGQ